MKLLKICIKANYFVYDNNIYTQNFGMPIGSPLSPVLGDLVMERLLDTVIPKFSFDVVFLKKYVDDIITSVPLGNVDEMLTIFNSFYETSVFGYEIDQGRLFYTNKLVYKTNVVWKTSSS